MKLSEKGRFAPPPVLPKHAQAVSVALAAQPGVHARTHWRLGDETQVDGADFYLGDEELGHLHLDGEAHVALHRALARALVAADLAAVNRWSRDFVTLPVECAADVKRATWLFALRRRQLEGAPVADLLREITARAAVS